MGNNVSQLHRKFQSASLMIKRSNGRYTPIAIHIYGKCSKPGGKNRGVAAEFRGGGFRKKNANVTNAIPK